MKATIKTAKKVTTSTGKDKALVTIEGSDKDYGCWDLAVLDMVGKEVECEEAARDYNGKTYYQLNLKKDSGTTTGGAAPSKGGWSGRSGGQSAREDSPKQMKFQRENFFVAYSKDAAIALLETKQIKSLMEFKDAMTEIYNHCHKLVGTTNEKPAEKPAEAPKTEKPKPKSDEGDVI